MVMFCSGFATIAFRKRYLLVILFLIFFMYYSSKINIGHEKVCIGKYVFYIHRIFGCQYLDRLK